MGEHPGIQRDEARRGFRFDSSEWIRLPGPMFRNASVNPLKLTTAARRTRARGLTARITMPGRPQTPQASGPPTAAGDVSFPPVSALAQQERPALRTPSTWLALAWTAVVLVTL